MRSLAAASLLMLLTGCQQAERDPPASPELRALEDEVATQKGSIAELAARLDAIESSEQALAAAQQAAVPAAPAAPPTVQTVIWESRKFATPGRLGFYSPPQPLDTFDSRGECIAAARAQVAKQKGTKDVGALTFVSAEGGEIYEYSYHCLPVGVDPRLNQTR